LRDAAREKNNAMLFCVREKYDGGVSSKDKKQERRFFVNEKIPTALVGIFVVLN